MANTHAGDYYRRSGFGGIVTRDRPDIWRRKNRISIREYNLEVGQTLELTIYPELTVREKPWTFWGTVVQFTSTGVVFRHIGGQAKGTTITIPDRYFKDGRVWAWAGGQHESESES